MGTRLESTDDSLFEEYKAKLYDLGHYLVYRIARVWLHSDFTFGMTSIGRKQKKAIAVLHNFTTTVIRNRKKAFLEKGSPKITEEDMETEDFIGSKKRLAMLDLLLMAESEGKIDEQGIREEVDTFMFEGHDTTTMAITFTLLLLANHRDIQDKIFEELDEIFQGSQRAATIDDLNKMKYLEMCLKEGLRIFPSVPFISRMLEEDVQLSTHLIPAGTICDIHILDLHRNPELYPSPDEFIPERFTQENCAKRHPYAYVPFSAGPRNCIGQKFAMYEEKSVISRVVRNYILEPVTKPSEVIFYADMVLRNKSPICVKFIPRNAK